MAVIGYEYNIQGENYLDIKSAADIIGVSYSQLHSLMRGVMFGKLNEINFLKKDKKIFLRKEEIKILKKAFSK